MLHIKDKVVTTHPIPRARGRIDLPDRSPGVVLSCIGRNPRLYRVDFGVTRFPKSRLIVSNLTDDDLVLADPKPVS